MITVTVQKSGNRLFPRLLSHTPLHICVVQNEFRVIFQTDTVATKLCVASLQFIFLFSKTLCTTVLLAKYHINISI